MQFRSDMRLFLAVVAAGLPAVASAQTAADGEGSFKQMCQACHVVGAGQRPTIAPNLRAVVGRKAGSTAYTYSPALKSSGLVWTAKNLDAFLTAPTKMVLGTRMMMAIPDANKRKGVIAYLATLK